MNFIKRVGLLIYMVLMVVVGATILLAALNLITAENLNQAMEVIHSSADYQWITAGIGALIILIGLIVPSHASKSLKKGRTITFQNPDGEVTVSVTAIEDYIRKIADDMPDVKDVRSHVNFTKKGINVTSAVSIHAGANIPEVMERIQMAVKNHIQTMLGVDEPINIKMHISRIIGTPPAEAVGPEEPQEESPQQVPFR